ncbi:hypothetical protein Tco_0168609 [Tanacetum coccineum]
MAALESCPKHNMIAYLEKTEGNVEFHEVIDFLQRSYISHALTVSPVVSTTFVEQFWTSAKSKTINNVRNITAKVAGKVVSISEASIRTELIFDDADGIDSLPNQAIFNAIQRMGYEGDLSVLTFNKALFSPQWRQLANIDVPLDHFPVNSLTSKVFSFMVKKGKHFSGKITPLFDNMLVQPTQEEGASSERLSEAQPSPSPTPTSEAPNESLPDSSSAQPSEVSDQAKEIKLLKAKITKLKKKATPVIKHFKAYQKRISKEQRQQRKSLSKKKRVQQESVSKQGRKNAKGDGKTKENAQNEGRSKEMMDEDKENDEVGLSTEDEVSTAKEKLSTDSEKVSTDRPKLSTDDFKVSTDEQMESTDDQVDASEDIFEGSKEKVESTTEQKESTEEQSKEEIASQASQTSTQTPTSMTFGDDETIATLLLNMSKAKAVSKQKEKGVELKDVEDTDRPRPTSTRSTLTLKPLPKIDPKDKGKKKIEEENETESEDDDIPQAVKKFKQLENDEELARKVQESFCGI